MYPSVGFPAWSSRALPLFPPFSPFGWHYPATPGDGAQERGLVPRERQIPVCDTHVRKDQAKVTEYIQMLGTLTLGRPRYTNAEFTDETCFSRVQV